MQEDSLLDLDAAEMATAVALVRQLDGSVGHEQVRPPITLPLVDDMCSLVPFTSEISLHTEPRLDQRINAVHERKQHMSHATCMMCLMLH